MKTRILEEPIELLCIRAKTFPEGIMEAFQEIKNRFGDQAGKECFGFTMQGESGLIYWAAIRRSAVTLSEQEGLELLTIEPGTYATQSIDHWQSKIELIGQTFEKLFSNEEVDPKSPGIEWYQNENELVCMAKMRNQ